MVSFLKKLLTVFKRERNEEFLWGLVGNIKDEIPYGHGGKEIKSGTKHFSPGTKVYCFPALWGDGYERIQVIGRHRGSKRFSCIILDSKCVTNWRKQKIYNPGLLRMIRKNMARFWESEKHVDQYFRQLALLQRNSND